MSRIQAITFDAGNTLIHPCPSLEAIYAQVSREQGVDLDPRRIPVLLASAYAAEAASRRPMEDGDAADRAMWERITRKIFEALPQIRALSFDDWFRALYERFGRPESWSVFPDVVSVLDVLRGSGYRLGILSNWDSRLRKILEGLGLLDRFDAVVISAEAGFRKPHPGIFDRALRALQAEEGSVLHVGDLAAEDVVGARNAGWRAVLLDRAGHLSPPVECPVLRSLEELPRYLGLETIPKRSPSPETIRPAEMCPKRSGTPK